MDACFGVALLFWTDSAGVKDAETHSVWAGRIGFLRDRRTNYQHSGHRQRQRWK